MLRLAPRCARLLSSAAPPPPPAPHKTKDFWNVLSGLNSYVKKFVARSPEERKASIASLYAPTVSAARPHGEHAPDPFAF